MYFKERNFFDWKWAAFLTIVSNAVIGVTGIDLIVSNDTVLVDSR
jgi:hypothetical protein